MGLASAFRVSSSSRYGTYDWRWRSNHHPRNRGTFAPIPTIPLFLRHLCGHSTDSSSPRPLASIGSTGPCGRGVLSDSASPSRRAWDVGAMECLSSAVWRLCGILLALVHVLHCRRGGKVRVDVRVCTWPITPWANRSGVTCLDNYSTGYLRITRDVRKPGRGLSPPPPPADKFGGLYPEVSEERSALSQVRNKALVSISGSPLVSSCVSPMAFCGGEYVSKTGHLYPHGNCCYSMRRTDRVISLFINDLCLSGETDHYST